MKSSILTTAVFSWINICLVNACSFSGSSDFCRHHILGQECDQDEEKKWENVPKCLDCGEHDYVCKTQSPFEKDELCYIISKTIKVRCTDSRDCKSLTIENEKWFCGFTNDGQVKGYCNKCESSSISYPNPCENPKTLSPSDFWEKSRTIEECKLNCPGGSHIFPQIDNQ